MTGNYSPLWSLFVLIISVLALAGCSGGSGIPSAEYQALLDKAVPEYQVMGMVAGVETAEGVWKGASGRANFATGAPMNPDLQIHVAGVTKPLTAAVAMKLVDDGVLKLDDTVEKWLPGAMVKNASLVTVSQLLSHTSGVFDHESLADFWAAVLADTKHEWTSDEILQISYAQDPYFAPGEGAKYSNTGYYILGMIVEAAAKGAFENTAQSLVFGPAGMTRTALTRQGTKTLPYSREYSVVQSGQNPRDVTEWNLSWGWTAGSAATTVEDMLAWTRAMAGGLIVKPATFAQMATPVAPSTSYGLGMSVTSVDPFLGEKALGQNGSNPGYVSQWVYYPNSKRTIFVAANRNDMVLTSSINPANQAMLAFITGVTAIWKSRLK